VRNNSYKLYAYPNKFFENKRQKRYLHEGWGARGDIEIALEVLHKLGKRKHV
jgi:hypothetical protein